VIGDGGEESWRVWLDRHGPALSLLARQHCVDTTDAADAVQDGFVRFWKSRDRAVDATGYLFACVRSAAIDLSRGRLRRERYEADASPAAAFDASAGDGVEQEELRQAVEAALATLPAEQREVIVLKIWGQLTFAQIAAALQINPDTAASRYRYARARLQAALRQEAGRRE
jgi:RNA polymerase sigma-70 factor (ECF subfamily)